MTETSFHRFFDDAAVFPPGLAPLDQAVSEHIRRSRNETADAFVGPLILPLDKAAEAVRLADGEPLRLAVVLPATRLPEAAELIANLARTGSTVRVDALEVKIDGDRAAGIRQAADFRGTHPALEVYVELPVPAVTDESVTELRNRGLGVKFRTGGVEKQLFPTPEQVIDVIDTAVRNDAPFKLTAGLHRAMRYTDDRTGFEHFGFLNIAAATAALRAGRGQRVALELLNSDDPAAVAAGLGDADTWRQSFRSFGTCSVTEPVETLAAIGRLSAETVRAF